MWCKWFGRKWSKEYERLMLHKLDEIIHLLKDLHHMEVVMSQELDALTTQVTENTEVEQSAILLLQGLAEQIASLKDDPAAIVALSEKLHASADALAAAITANTPTA